MSCTPSCRVAEFANTGDSNVSLAYDARRRRKVQFTILYVIVPLYFLYFMEKKQFKLNSTRHTDILIDDIFDARELNK